MDKASETGRGLFSDSRDSAEGIYSSSDKDSDFGDNRTQQEKEPAELKRPVEMEHCTLLAILRKKLIDRIALKFYQR